MNEASAASAKQSQVQAERQEQIRDNIMLVVGGNFTPDALGPERHGHVVALILASPERYLDEFNAMFIGEKFDASAQANLYLIVLLEIAATKSPARASDTTRRLLRQYDQYLLLYDHVSDQNELLEHLPEDLAALVRRLVQRRDALRKLLP